MRFFFYNQGHISNYRKSHGTQFQKSQTLLLFARRVSF